MQIVIAMHKLLEKIVNCYDRYLKALNYGKAVKPSPLLYNAIIFEKSGIENDVYEEYFYNNLKCPTTITLPETTAMNRIISWALSSQEEASASFTWTEQDATALKTYSVTTTPKQGFNYFYVSVPQDVNFIISDALGNVLFNSTLVPSEQHFTLAGTVTTTKGQNNAVYRDNNVFNSNTPITFTVKLF